MSKIEAIANELAVIFNVTDKEYVERQKVWAIGRVAAIKEYKLNNKCTYQTTNSYYAGLFNVAGGKTWYNVFNGRSMNAILEFVEKNCAATIEKRNFKIAKKLIENGVETLGSGEYSKTADGLNGVWRVETDKGLRVVIIETIIAGGYNVQCMHQRTLVKVK